MRLIKRNWKNLTAVPESILHKYQGLRIRITEDLKIQALILEAEQCLKD